METARAKLRERFGEAAGGRIGGKGAPRRKKKAVHKAAAVDEKRVQSTLKPLGLSTIPGIEEVSMLMSDDKVLHFSAPRVQAAPNANTYVVSGQSDEKPASEVQKYFPSTRITQAMLEKLLQAASEGKHDEEALAKMLSAGQGPAAPRVEEEEDDDTVPDLVENFDADAL
eukprot:Lankesteria_metandrocarpae@DN4131_c0_g1_i1.p1